MNPVISDLAIYIVEHESRHTQERQRLVRLAHEATRSNRPQGRISHLAKSLANGIWQFLDPRGFAMAQLAELPVSTPEAPVVSGPNQGIGQLGGDVVTLIPSPETAAAEVAKAA